VWTYTTLENNWNVISRDLARLRERSTRGPAKQSLWHVVPQVGIGYSTHLTFLSSKLSSIAELINSLPAKYRMAALEQGTLESGRRVRNDDDQAGVQFHLAEKSNKIDPVVRDEREFIPDDALGSFPVRSTAQAEMIDVGCFESRAMSDSD
jgi:hypothetical protein